MKKLNTFAISLFCLFSASTQLLDASSPPLGLDAPWNNLVIADTKDIIHAIRQLAQDPNFISNSRAVTFTERAFNALALRKHSSNDQAAIFQLKEGTNISHHYCTLKGCYIPESAGILKKTIDKHANKNEVVHVYGCATKKLYHTWADRKKPNRFEKYLKKRARKADLQTMRKNILQYHSHAEREAFAVHFVDGKFMQNGQFMHGRYIYVLNAAGTTLYAGRKQVGKIQHSTFTAGEPVQCAGWIFLNHGVYETANLSSGHYKPSVAAGHRLRAFLRHEARLGIAAETIPITKHY